MSLTPEALHDLMTSPPDAAWRQIIGAALKLASGPLTVCRTERGYQA